MLSTLLANTDDLLTTDGELHEILHQILHVFYYTKYYATTCTTTSKLYVYISLHVLYATTCSYALH